MEKTRKRTASSAESSPKKSRKRSSTASEIEEPVETEKMEIEVDPPQDLKKTKSRKLSSRELLSSNDSSGLNEVKLAFFEKISVLNIFDANTEQSTSLDEDVIAEFRVLFNKLEDEEISEKRVLVDQFLRDYLLEKAVGEQTHWNSFLDLSIKLARAGIASASIPVALITDLVELSTLQSCEGVFQFVENHLETWREPFFLNAGKNAVLRMCNDLLRRLSRAQNTIFCGRILIFLSNYFPFSERSGLNIMSEFNAENLTVYKTGDGSDDPEDKMEISIEKEELLFEGMDLQIPGLDQMVSMCQEEKKKGMTVDYNLYVKFWSLQDFFRNPLQCYNKIAWKAFTTYSGDVLGAFQCFKIESAPIKKRKLEGKDGANVESSSINIIPRLGDEDLYFAKYLTNRRLLELQMGDPTFRRYFMVQLLIVLQYLTLNVKFKGESHVLNEEQLDYIRKNTEKIYELMADVPPDGKDFVASVKHILRREELWNKWKNDGCPVFKRPTIAQTVSTDSKEDKEDKLDGDEDKDKGSAKGISTPVKPVPTAKAGQAAKNDNVGLTVTDDISLEIEESVKQKPKRKRRQLGDIIKEATQNKKFLLGNSELTRLWNICPDNLEACRAKARDFMPPIETFFAEAMKELDPEPAVIPDPKKEVKPKKILGNANFGWRALRLLARRSPYFFQMVSGSPIHPLQNYLEYVLKKIATDLEVPIGSGDCNGVNNDIKPEPNLRGPSIREAPADIEGEMEAGAEDDEELIKPESRKDDDGRDEEEGEVRNEKLRNLTYDETVALGKTLGDDWKKLALKLGFKKDEIEFFEAERKDKAGEYMLTMWTEQEGEDATVADLLYRLEGLGLLAKGEAVIVS